METALVHGIDLAHQDVGGDLVLGPAEFSERGQEGQIVERFDRQGQT